MRAHKSKAAVARDDQSIFVFPLADALTTLASADHRAAGLAFIFLCRMDAMGLSRAQGDRRRLERAIEEGLAVDRVNLPISKKRLLSANLSEAEFVAKMQEPVSDAEVGPFIEIVENAVSASTEAMIQRMASAHGRFVRQNGAEILVEHRALKAAFLSSLRKDWGKALDQFEIFVEMAREVGDTGARYLETRGLQSDVAQYKPEAIFRLYARACQIAEEISVLLERGFADGAQARWRSLHEIQVVLTLLSDGDEELARRYLSHHDIDLYNEAKATLAFGNTAFQRISHEEFSELETARSALLQEFGEQFDAAYGWASELLGFKATRFSDLEQLAGENYIRPIYKSASANVHASSRGTLTRLGMPDPFDHALAGASAHGLSHAALGACHSLVLAAVKIAEFVESPDVMAKAVAMHCFADELRAKFERSERRALQPLRRASRSSRDTPAGRAKRPVPETNSGS